MFYNWKDQNTNPIFCILFYLASDFSKIQFPLKGAFKNYVDKQGGGGLVNCPRCLIGSIK